MRTLLFSATDDDSGFSTTLVVDFYSDFSAVSTATGCGSVTCTWRERADKNGKKFIECSISLKNEYFPLSVEVQTAYQAYLVNKLIFET